jgi:hypothetical protein
MYDMNPVRFAMYTKHCKIGRIEKESGETVDSVYGWAYLPFHYVTGEIIQGRDIYFYPISIPGGELAAKKRAWIYGHEGPRVGWESEALGNLKHMFDASTRKSILAMRIMDTYSHKRMQTEEEEKRQAFTDWIKQRKGVK